MAELKMEQEILVKELAFFAKEGGVEPELIEKMVAYHEKINAASTEGYTVHGSVVGALVYIQIQLVMQRDRKCCNMKVGGFFGFGANSLDGKLYTDNLERLYRDTRGVTVILTPVYTNGTLYDADENVLGQFHLGGVGTMGGAGVGTAKWE